MLFHIGRKVFKAKLRLLWDKNLQAQRLDWPNLVGIEIAPKSGRFSLENGGISQWVVNNGG